MPGRLTDIGRWRTCGARAAQLVMSSPNGRPCWHNGSDHAGPTAGPVDDELLIDESSRSRDAADPVERIRVCRSDDLFLGWQGMLGGSTPQGADSHSLAELLVAPEVLVVSAPLPKGRSLPAVRVRIALGFGTHRICGRKPGPLPWSMPPFHRLARGETVPDGWVFWGWGCPLRRDINE
jgi:hypothetical protein